MEANVPHFQDFPFRCWRAIFLLLFVLGSYFTKLAKSYYAEHLRKGLSNIEILI